MIKFCFLNVNICKCKSFVKKNDQKQRERFLFEKKDEQLFLRDSQHPILKVKILKNSGNIRINRVSKKVQTREKSVQNEIHKLLEEVTIGRSLSSYPL